MSTAGPDRSSGRSPSSLRPTRIDPGFVSTATGSALITQGSSEQQLRVHTRWAIQHGWSRGQLEALATLLGLYAGCEAD